jgi:hypothetical protein
MGRRGVGREQRGQVLLLGKGGITTLQHFHQDALGGLDREVPHVDGESTHLELLRPPSFCCVGGSKRFPSSPGTLDDVSAFLCRWGCVPQDRQIEIGGAVGISSRDRAFDSHGCHLRVVVVVRCDLLRQPITQATFFVHQRSPLAISDTAGFILTARVVAEWLLLRR